MSAFNTRFDRFSSFYLYGATPAASGTIELLQAIDKQILGFVDKDSTKQNTDFMGYNVYAPSVLSDAKNNDTGIIIVSAYQLEIAGYLQRVGIDAQRVFPHLDGMFFPTYTDSYLSNSTLDVVAEKLGNDQEKGYFSSWRHFKETGNLYALKALPEMKNQYEHAAWWQTIGQGGLCGDIGAYDGVSSIEFAKTGSFSKIVAVEPFRENFNLLKATIKEHGYQDLIEPLQIAAGQSRETIWQDTEDASSRSRLNANSNVSSVDKEQIEVFPIDALDMQGLTMLKVDIEGFELAFLEGATETIKKYRPHIAISAYHEKTHCCRIFEFFQRNFDGWSLNVGHHPQAVYELEYYISFDQGSAL
ncbi:FkbM family methyltransferase [Kordiimonas aquimaris]|uniref:FkbM family methyltransferase n=1 Tax=Kordiimonas aquimaris TaxID=707591 RepID=UPI0021CEABA0|nr:FkbM family methyltransferase [Kordiimonas aquimaris]